MTIVLTLGNADQIIQVSDMRLSSNGRLIDDDAFKGGIFICSNARFVFGFTGLARCDGFDTERWLLENLVKSGNPDFDAQSTLDRLTQKATQDFKNLPSLRKVPSEYKRLSVMFSGYLYSHSPPLGAYAIMTNFQDFATSQDASAACDLFKCSYWNEKKPRQENFTFIQRVGARTAMSTGDEVSLRTLLSERKPAKAVVDKAVQIIRNMADWPQAAGTIGKQLLSVTLPRDFNAGFLTEYHSMYPRKVTYFAPMAISTRDRQMAMAENALSAEIPIVFPRVGRNEPCPCGSGKKYKKCHGFH